MLTIDRRFPSPSPLRVALVALIALVLAGTIIAKVGSPDSAGSSAEESLDLGQPQNRSKGVDSAVAGSTGVMTDAGLAGSAPAPPVGKIAETSAVDVGSSPVVPGAPRIVRAAELRVEVTSRGFDAAFDRVSTIAASNGGFVASSSTSTSPEFSPEGLTRADKRSLRTAELTVRIPADRFDVVRQALAGLGKVQSQSIRGEDVSGQLVDVGARLRSLSAQEEALRLLMTKAVAVGEVIQVQSQLFAVRQQIEQLDAQRADLDGRAALSTISVSLFEPGAIFGPEPLPTTGLASSFQRALDAAVAVAGGMVVAVGWSAPFAILGLAVWGVSRLRRRRHAAQATP